VSAEALPNRGVSPIQRAFQRWDLWLIVLLGLYFLGRLFYFAFTVGPGVPPDEMTHIGTARLYAETLFGVEDSAATLRYGLVTHVPYLYYFLIGKSAALLGDAGYITLRVLNIGLALAFLVVAYRLSLLVLKSRLMRVLFFVMLTNTLMFSFLSASVNYDNLTNLLALLAVYFLVRYLCPPVGCLHPSSGYSGSGDPADLLLFFISTALGLLTKGTFLMLAPVFTVVWLLSRRQTLGADMQQLIREIRSGRRYILVLAAVAFLCVVANLSLYGTNLVRYGHIVPSCGQVLSHEKCMENRIYARNWVVSQYRTDNLSYMDAWRATEAIRHPGDIAHAKRLLNNERQYKVAKPENLNMLDYMHLVWDQAMKPSVFGIQAHRSMLRSPNELWVYGVICFAALMLMVRTICFDGSDKQWLGMVAIVFGYYLFLVGYYNYTGYLEHHALLLGVQGRYLFHVLVPAYLLMAEFLLRPFPKWGQVTVACAVASVFIMGDFPYYLSRVTEVWANSIG